MTPTVTRDAEGTVTGNTYDKYGSTNPVVKRLMAGFERTLDELWAKAAPRSVLDVGCGEGVLTSKWASRLRDGRVVGIDLADPALQAEWARRSAPNLEYRVMKAESLPFGDGEFELAAAVVVFLALVVWARFLVALIDGDGKGHVQSLILGAVLFNAAVVLAALAVMSDLLSGQRIMLQRVFERVRRIELHLNIPPSHYEPGAQPTGQEATTGANAPGGTEEREALKL